MRYITEKIEHCQDCPHMAIGTEEMTAPNCKELTYWCEHPNVGVMRLATADFPEIPESCPLPKETNPESKLRNGDTIREVKNG